MPQFPSYRERYLPACSAQHIKDILRSPAHLVIMPLGAIEQHGPHLPVGTDSLIGEILLDGLHQNLVPHLPLVFTPAIHITKSNEHTGFPGTLMLQKKTLLALVGELVDEVTAQGFYRFAFLNTHGGNTSCLNTFINERRCEKTSEFYILNPMPETGMSHREKIFGIHAGEYESSLLYAATPDACKPDRADCQWIDQDLHHPDIKPEFAPVTFAWAASDLTSTGTMGDAAAASVEKGEKWISAAVSSLCAQVEALLK